jgi:hypothetical protein
VTPLNARGPTPNDAVTGATAPQVKLRMLGVWSVLVYLVLLILGWAVIGGLLPPLAPVLVAKRRLWPRPQGTAGPQSKSQKQTKQLGLQGEACSILLRTSTAFATAT